MKKKCLIVLIPIVLLSGAVLRFAAVRSLGFCTGPCIAAANGSYMIVMGNSPVVLHSRSEHMFEDLTTGDRIFIIHDGVQESYPGGTGVYYLRKLSDGSVKDVPAQVLEALGESGWEIE